MQQIMVEMYNYRNSWHDAAPEVRASFVDGLLASFGKNPVPGMEIIAYAANDPTTDKGAPYDFFCVYRMPDSVSRRQFEEVVAASGWYDYFDQVNLAGAAMSPLGLLRANQRLRMPHQVQDVSPHALPKSYAVSHGLSMAYTETTRPERDEGGPTIVLVHGDAMSSYLWRNVLPHLAGLGRVVAVDLIGAGDSDKLPQSGPSSYSFAEHARYLDGLLEALDVGDDVVLVGHDWGSNLAFDWALRHPGRVSGLAFCEAILPPFAWEDWAPDLVDYFHFLRTPEGERAVLDDNAFVLTTQRAILRMMRPEEMAEIVRPYREPGEARRPTITWPREVPFAEDDTPTREAVEAQASWLAASDLPKLHLLGSPGSLSFGRRLELIRGLPTLEEVVVPGAHWPPEDGPHEMGHAIAAWIVSHHEAG